MTDVGEPEAPTADDDGENATHQTGHGGHGATPPTGRRLAALSLLALGVVFGDIGTSPLYALRECFHGEHPLAPSHGNVLGVLSLIFWALVVVISIKYLVYVMRADNDGEGGILALMALAERSKTATSSKVGWWLLTMLALFGAALLYGDGVITPAISVLSAIEGLELASPAFADWVIPVTLVILFALFWVQHRGTASIGKIFGPVTLVWFIAIAAFGIAQIADAPRVLEAERIDARFTRVVGRYGFTETRTVMELLANAERAIGIPMDLDTATFFLSRETLLATERPGMVIWREKLFAYMSRNAQRATAFFGIPPEQVVEMGVQIEL